jgi:hypothetical protein
MEGNRLVSNADWYDMGVEMKEKLLENGCLVDLYFVIKFDKFLEQLMSAAARLQVYVDKVKFMEIWRLAIRYGKAEHATNAYGSCAIRWMKTVAITRIKAE